MYFQLSSNAEVFLSSERRMYRLFFPLLDPPCLGFATKHIEQVLAPEQQAPEQYDATFTPWMHLAIAVPCRPFPAH